jgi:hypothetical protein
MAGPGSPQPGRRLGERPTESAETDWFSPSASLSWWDQRKEVVRLSESNCGTLEVSGR